MGKNAQKAQKNSFFTTLPRKILLIGVKSSPIKTAKLGCLGNLAQSRIEQRKTKYWQISTWPPSDYRYQTILSRFLQSKYRQKNRYRCLEQLNFWNYILDKARGGLHNGDMVEFIQENWLIKRFKKHPLYLFFGPILGWVMSNFLTTPTITATAIVLLVYLALVILLEVWIKSKICRWMSDIWCYRTIYFGLLIICILAVWPFWGNLVYACDRDNPYKQPLRTATASVEIRFEINGNNNVHIHYLKRQRTCIVLYEKEPLLSIESTNGNYLPNIHNEPYYRFTAIDFSISDINEIGRPLKNFMKANKIAFFIPDLPADSIILGGHVTLVFNSSLIFEISIPYQKPNFAKGAPYVSSIIIPDIGKHLKQGK